MIGTNKMLNGSAGTKRQFVYTDISDITIPIRISIRGGMRSVFIKF